jgi:hypothetical protein
MFVVLRVTIINSELRYTKKMYFVSLYNGNTERLKNIENVRDKKI